MWSAMKDTAETVAEAILEWRRKWMFDHRDVCCRSCLMSQSSDSARSAFLHRTGCTSDNGFGEHPWREITELFLLSFGVSGPQID